MPQAKIITQDTHLFLTDSATSLYSKHSASGKYRPNFQFSDFYLVSPKVLFHIPAKEDEILMPTSTPR
jgi:hypothetical protein